MTAMPGDACAGHGSVYIRLNGEIDRANVAAIERQIRAAVSGQPPGVSVDLTNVTYLDSTGKRLLFELASLLQESRIVLNVIVSFDSPTRRLIELSALQSLAALLLTHPDDRGGEVGPIELMAPAQPESLNNIRDALRRWLTAASATPRVIDDVLVAVGEACANVIDHAYGPDGGIMTVHMQLQGPEVVATMGDPG
jgi:anti-anti-sigma factor